MYWLRIHVELGRGLEYMNTPHDLHKSRESGQDGERGRKREIKQHRERHCHDGDGGAQNGKA